MARLANTVTQSARGTGPAVTPAGTIASELQPLSLEALSADKPPIELLPNELLANIFDFLDSPKPSSSESALHDEPHFDLTKSDNAPLKAISCVSKRCRRGILPLLFKHPRFGIKSDDKRWTTIDQMIKPFLEFIVEHELSKTIKSFTFMIHHKVPADIIFRQESSFDFSAFWNGIFKAMDPLELLIVAPAEALGILTNCRVNMDDAWSFDCPSHYLRLRRHPGTPTHATNVVQAPHESPASINDSSQSSEDPEPSSQVFAKSESRRSGPNLWDLRPWTSLLLNEGSFIRAYATYEFWLRKTPSILPDLVGAEDEDANDLRQGPLISPTIRDFAYIGLFPMASHFAAFTANCPRLDRLYVQLVPRNEILQQASKMAQVEAEDLWMERNSCYALLMRELFNAPPMGNYKYLQEFESGDAADTDAWLMAVEFVKRATHNWKVAGEGVFVRDTTDKTASSGAGQEEDSLTLSVVDESEE